MRAEIVPNEPAMLLTGRRKLLLVADLHIGLVDFYDESIVDRLRNLAERLEVDEILVLGDLKHRIGRYERLKRLFDGFDVPLVVVKGNHDGGLDCFEVLSSRGVRIGKFGLFHGHATPSDDVMEANTLVFAHAHPSVLVRDGVWGFKERVWVFGEFEGKRIVVMPAFNDLCAFTPINVTKPAGVIFKKWNYGNADVVTLDGTYLGRVGIV